MLNVYSKICEKALKQFSGFLSRTGHLSTHQSGNKKYHSTKTFDILVSKLLLNAMEKKSSCSLRSVVKAFDSTDHARLLRKLSRIGVFDQIFGSFTRYLSDRKQVVRIASSTPETFLKTRGLPQGANLATTVLHACKQYSIDTIS